MSKRRWAAGLTGIMVVAGSATLLPGSPTTAATTGPGSGSATQVRSALGSGLGRLVADSQGAASKQRSGTTGVRIDPDGLTVRDDRGRVLVQLTPQQGIDRAAFRKQAEAQGFEVQSSDAGTGMLEGYVPLSSVGALAGLKGTGTLAQSVRPKTHIGKATSQGVVQQRVDKVLAKGVDGKGITIGVLSDSFDTAVTNLQDGGPLLVHAAEDVKSGDLPGKGNPKYPTPVVNLEDYDDETATDEGRGMMQIVHDVAPGAKLCFASAFISETRFAENIRRLADKKGRCGADVIVDDVSYGDEPSFSDGILSDAIDDVAAKGVHYFTSAGNDGEDKSWNSDVRLIPATRGLKGTNLDFSEVDPALYDGGLQDMDPGSGTDVAQDVSVGEAGTSLNLQWDDPVDLDGATYGDPVFSDSGTLSDADPAQTFTWNATAADVGQQVEFRTDGVPSGTTDLVLEVTDPAGNSLGEIDTGTSPEVLAATVTQAGAYQITITGYDGATGPFTVQVRPVTAPSRVTTDFNVLIFDTEGAYLGALADLNPLSGRPQELAGLDGIGDIQIVIARAGTGEPGATKLRNVLSGAYFTEYSDPLSPAHTGHTIAAGASSVAAYDPFKSYLPEPYTSPGGRLPIYFDSEGNRYRSPQIRQVPALASTDRGNTTFFAADDLRDPDTLPNFGGTSASAPHAAAIAALVLQKAGGPTSLRPTALRRHLQATAFDHDLDPMASGGSAKGLTVTARGNQGRETTGTTPGSINDPNFFRIAYSGKAAVRSVTFYGETASPTAPGKRNPPASDGIVFDTRPFTGESPWNDQGFPFTVGGVSGGLAKASVSPVFSVPGGGESVPGQFRRLTVNFKNGLKSGQAVRFGVDRDLASSPYGDSSEGNGADELGGAIFLPQGNGGPQGMVFVATLSNGQQITGRFSNRLGDGWTPADGFGMVNAERAVDTAR